MGVGGHLGAAGAFLCGKVLDYLVVRGDRYAEGTGWAFLHHGQI